LKIASESKYPFAWKTTTRRQLVEFGSSLDTKANSVKLSEVDIEDCQRSAGSYLIFAVRARSVIKTAAERFLEAFAESSG